MKIKIIFLILLLFVSDLSADSLSSITLTEGMFTTFGLWVNGTLNSIFVETGFYRLIIVCSILLSLKNIFLHKNIVQPLFHVGILTILIFLFARPGNVTYDFNDMIITGLQTEQEENEANELAKSIASYEVKKSVTGFSPDPSDYFLKIYSSIDRLVNVIIDSIDQNYRYSHLKYKTYQINNKIDTGLHDPTLINQFKIYNELCYYPALTTFADGDIYNDSEVSTQLRTYWRYGELSPFYIRDETNLYSTKQSNMDLTVHGCKEKTNELTTSLLTKSYDRNHPLYNSREEAVSAGIDLMMFKVGEYTPQDWAKKYIQDLYLKGEHINYLSPEKRVELDENLIAEGIHKFSTWKESIGKYVSFAAILEMYPYVQGVTLGFFISIFPIILCYSFFGNYTILAEYFKMIFWVKSWTIVTTLVVLFDKMSVSFTGAAESAMEVALYSMALSAPAVSFILIRVTSQGIATGVMSGAMQASSKAGSSAVSLVEKAGSTAVSMAGGPTGIAAKAASMTKGSPSSSIGKFM